MAAYSIHAIDNWAFVYDQVRNSYPLVALTSQNIRPKVLVFLSFSILPARKFLEATVNTVCGVGNSHNSFVLRLPICNSGVISR